MFNLLPIISILLIIFRFAEPQCNNNCNGHGMCNIGGSCSCFQGWGGFDCSGRICPSGPQFADIPYDTDSAHQMAPCSGHGQCITATGLCKCDDGYSGLSCSKTNCPNDCSGNGVCKSISAAASEYDGYFTKHATTYNLWDGDLIHGCFCDPGYSGYDCSQRTCDVGVDPRLATSPSEVVTLVCDCTGITSTDCNSGKVKFRFMGKILKTSFTPSSLASSIATGLKSVPGVIYGSLNFDSSIDVSAVASIDGNAASSSNPICQSSSIVKTSITFRRQLNDAPSISFYLNTFKNAYFEVINIIMIYY